MKKIAILLPSLLPVPAVSGGAVETLINNMIKQNEIDKKFQFTIYSIWNKDAYEASKNYNYTNFVYFKTNILFEKIHNYLYRLLKKIFKKSISDTRVRNKMVKNINQDDYDYILFEAGEVFCLKKYSKRLNKEKILVHAHGMIEPIQEIDNCFSYYLPISEYVGDYWKRKSKRDLNSYKVWKNCIFLNNFSKKVTNEEKNTIRSKYAIKENEYVVLFTGRMIKEKGVLELLNSYQYLKHKNVKYLLIGSSKFAVKTRTNYENKIVEIVSKNKENFIFTGYVDNSNLYKYYSIAQIQVVPSICEEGAGLVLIEGMASGIPIITTGTGGMKEYITEESAILVNNDEKLSINIAKKIDELIDNKDLYNKLCKNAKKQSKSFDMKMYLNRLEEIINEIN